VFGPNFAIAVGLHCSKGIPLTISITLNDELVAGLEPNAKQRQLSVEQLAIKILMDAVTGSRGLTPEEVVAKIQARRSQPISARTPSANLANLLGDSEIDPNFDQQKWRREWAAMEAEMKEMTKANNMAEGRGNIP
jgi:hypothetical protein